MKMKKFMALLLSIVMVFSLCSIGVAAEGTNEAKIGTTEYATLAAAVTAANSGDTITLINSTDISLTGLTISKTITLDLNGKQIKAANTGTGNIKITKAGNLTLTDSTDTARNGSGTGKIYTESDYSASASFGLLEDKGIFTMESGYINAVRNDAANKGQFAVTVMGSGSKAVINGGKIEAGWYAIAGNGTASVASGTDITVNGGELISTADFAIYHPTHNGKLTINDGIVYGYAGGIAMNAGELNVTGGLISSKGVGSTGNWGDGTGNLKNAAISFPAKYDGVTATIKNATVSAEGNAIAVDSKLTQSEVSISDVTFLVSTDSGLKGAVDTINSYGTVSAATTGNTITLLNDITADVTISADKTVTLDLNGKTLTNAAGNTITNNGTLTIKDSQGNGTIVCPTAGKSALLNEPGANATIQSGKLLKNRNVDSNDYYVITNHGTSLTITGGNIESQSTHSSAIENGWYTPSENSSKATSLLTISGGKVSANSNNETKVDGGLYTLKNDDYGKMVISGGTFSNTGADTGTVLNWNVLEISGGTFTATHASVATMAVGTENSPKYSYELGKTTISGGNFNGFFGIDPSYSAAITVSITGGKFSSDPSDYVADGYKVNAISNSPYNFQITKVPENVIESASGTVLNGSSLVTGTDVAVSVSNGAITVSGRLSAEDKSVKLKYTCTDGKTGMVTVTYDENNKTFIANPQTVTVGNTTYAVVFTDLTVLPAEVKVVYPAVKPVPSPELPPTNPGGTEPTARVDAANDAAKAINDSINTPNNTVNPVKADGLEAAVANETIKSATNGETTVNVSGTPKATTAVISETKADDKTPESIKNATDKNPAVVVVVPQIKIEVVDASVEDGKTTITYDISALSQVVVSNRNTPPSAIKTAGDGQNAVAVGDAQPVTVNTPVTITIPIPSSFKAPLYVKHTHGNVTETVLAKVNDNGTATFTVNGLSEVTLMSDARSCTVNFDDGTTQTMNLAETVLHTPTAPAGKYFVGWKLSADGITGYDGTYTQFTDTMLDDFNGKDVTATAVFATIPTGSATTTYAVTVKTAENGAVKSSADKAAKGETVTLTVTPAQGYTVKALTAADATGAAVTLTKVNATTYTFVMPGADVTVTPAFASNLPYSDVKPDNWAYESIQWAYNNGYMTGTSATAFAPQQAVTRQQLWMVLARISKANPADMAAARTWAMTNGISDGTNPTATVTREQMVTTLYRYAMKFCGLAAEDTGSMGMAGFSDTVSISTYAYPAMHWAVRTGLIKGITGTTLVPTGTTTRDQFATLLMRFCQSYVK